jgi:hypothetical protein
MTAIFYVVCMMAGFALHGLGAQYFERVPEEWEQAVRTIDRKYELKYNQQQIAIEEMQGRIVTLENRVDDLVAGNELEAALDRRWGALGDEE